MVRLSELIAPSFFDVYRDIRARGHTHYVLKGGRGSTKSSFVGISMVMGLLRAPDTHAVCMRAVGATLHDSVYTQILWAIDALGLTHLFRATVSPLKITYIPTGQTILFRGTDDPVKLKSIKAPFGYIGHVWFEEWSQFDGADETRAVLQSLLRGGDRFAVYYTYNPPQSANAWVNAEVQVTRPDRLIHHSDYRNVPRVWLGTQFLLEAEHLAQTKPEAYAHEYLGEVTGTGGEVFSNVKIRPITQEEITAFAVRRRGLDFGYAVDPAAYVECAYERKHRRLFIYREIVGTGISNHKLTGLIRKENGDGDMILADGAEPKSIAEMSQYGLRITGVKKGPDSVDYGIKFLQDLEEIIIDDVRCPHAAREFLSYELERDARGAFKSTFPDRDNHTIDAVRYALNAECANHRTERQKAHRQFNFKSERPDTDALRSAPGRSFFTF